MTKRDSASAAMAADADGMTYPPLTWSERLSPWAAAAFWKRWCAFWREEQGKAFDDLLTAQVENDALTAKLKEADAAVIRVGNELAAAQQGRPYRYSVPPPSDRELKLLKISDPRSSAQKGDKH